ncbi:peptidoglycan-binding domain-containing protein [Flavobacterium capsici]|uniref:Peptidoglycan-binding protein n=1 Tax=Flavobacterium capsici TaxID=3075618 RepID=A0AA96EYN3_9FLAO|nr:MULTISPECIES: hypothetical protein [unclassified Flavobacterium]WNM19287.1 hypothetical protein RN608_01060 [Flavobacterium sp. PMR2A8]WNM20676.1 hypothetical protein RN605_08230 [Flavobacterium sp. PMTSA4]
MKSNNTYLYAGLGLLTIIGVVSLSRKKAETTTDIPFNENPTTPLPIVLDENKLLKKGSTGPEVQKLQEMLNVGADGVFGSITEAALYRQKAVKQTTLKQFVALPNANPDRIPSGSRVMINNPNGSNLYIAQQNADKLWYKTNDVFLHMNFGREAGVVRSSTQLGDWYLVLYGNYKMIFVKATDVKKI